jgi:hypothetical protein
MELGSEIAANATYVSGKMENTAKKSVQGNNSRDRLFATGFLPM